MWQEIYNFFNSPPFVMWGGISASLIVFGVLINIVLATVGVAPLLWRLGYGRWFRKIAIVANSGHYEDLRTDLISSGIFRKGNIFSISSQNLAKVKDGDLMLVHYKSFSETEIKTILSNKKSKSGMIFYFPEKTLENKISAEMTKEIGAKENTTIVNFRGRLLNDIVTTLITTSYEKR
ncbi:MAG: hypothetical protein NTY04_00040 [Candidatus Staskawiczbacteria bacterium]|nr:hypothetical protein [Candidatus Staskawiczbacteria bacterium]